MGSIVIKRSTAIIYLQTFLIKLVKEDEMKKQCESFFFVIFSRFIFKCYSLSEHRFRHLYVSALKKSQVFLTFVKLVTLKPELFFTYLCF